jgi:NAD(P)-dependent dehydrogenase (short-subunit alcohol dehydrogenase family)
MDELAADGFRPQLRRLEGRAAVVVGGGQTPGATVGNGRATAVLLARHGASVLVVDRDAEAAAATAAAITAEGGVAEPFAADITDEAANAELVAACVERFGALDILHNNVGASVALGDAPALELDGDAFDRIVALNLKAMWLTCKHAVPVMRGRRRGSIVNISSMAAWSAYPFLAYKATKAGVIALTENLAMAHAADGVRVNVILPGLMNTPMAIEARVAAGADRDRLIAQRDAQVPLGGKMGSGWDVAAAALWLHSDEARFVTGVALPVDGGANLKRG